MALGLGNNISKKKNSEKYVKGPHLKSTVQEEPEMKGGNKEDMLSVLHRLFGTLTKTEIEFVAAICWVYVACKEQIHL